MKGVVSNRIGWSATGVQDESVIHNFLQLLG